MISKLVKYNQLAKKSIVLQLSEKTVDSNLALLDVISRQTSYHLIFKKCQFQICWTYFGRIIFNQYAQCFNVVGSHQRAFVVYEKRIAIVLNTYGFHFISYPISIC